MFKLIASLPISDRAKFRLDTAAGLAIGALVGGPIAIVLAPMFWGMVR